jgi:uncharacterized membrane protein SpoIIM required for sporulation
MFVPNIWKNASSKRKRMMSIAVFFLAAVSVSAIGSLMPLTTEEANDINTGLNQTANALDSLPALNQVSFIFGNNFMLCLLAFIPFFGALWEFYVMLSTGVAIAAISYGQVNPLAALFSLFIFPFTWLEFLAYSIAITESFWLFWRLIHKKGKTEIKNASILISISAVLLLVAAIIETAIIGAIG